MRRGRGAAGRGRLLRGGGLVGGSDGGIGRLLLVLRRLGGLFTGARGMVGFELHGLVDGLEPGREATRLLVPVFRVRHRHEGQHQQEGSQSHASR